MDCIFDCSVPKLDLITLTKETFQTNVQLSENLYIDTSVYTIALYSQKMNMNSVNIKKFKVKLFKGT